MKTSLDDITLLSVSFKSRSLLLENREVVRGLHEGQAPRWLVVENSPEADSERLQADDPFEILPAVPTERGRAGHGSYQHARGLEKALAAATTRFVVLIDPDFYVVLPGWLKKVADHLHGCQSPFFGAPYYPHRFDKYRYFPSVTFMAIDLERVARRDLDFEPELIELEILWQRSEAELKAWVGGGALPTCGDVAIDRLLENRRDLGRSVLRARRLLRRCPERLRGWLRVEGNRWADVGVRIARRFAREFPWTNEDLQPVWNNPLFTGSPSFNGRLLRWLGRTLLPDQLSRFPRRRDYATTARFVDFGLEDHLGAGHEEYFWRGRPFAYHLSGVKRPSRT